MKPATILAFLLTAFFAHQARADLAGDYAALHQTLRLDLSADPEQQYLATEQRIRDMAGRWIPVSVLAGNSPVPPPPELLRKACENFTMDIVPTSQLGFTALLGIADSRNAIRFQAAGGMDYFALPDEPSLRARLFRNSPDTVKPSIAWSMVAHGHYAGTVMLIPAGANLLIVKPERVQPEVWGRCG